MGVQSDDWSAIRHYSLVNKSVGERDLKLSISTLPLTHLQRISHAAARWLIRNRFWRDSCLFFSRSLGNLLFWLSDILLIKSNRVIENLITFIRTQRWNQVSVKCAVQWILLQSNNIRNTWSLIIIILCGNYTIISEFDELLYYWWYCVQAW